VTTFAYEPRHDPVADRAQPYLTGSSLVGF